MSNTSFIVPKGHVQARAYICIPVDESLTTRSSVMAALMDCEGIVELPPGVEVDDLLTWAKTMPEHARSLSTKELSRTLKVGDQMGDQHSSVFAEAMATKLDDKTWMHDPEIISQFSENFLPLHSNLKGLVFQHLLASGLELKDVAETWPLPMKIAFFDALVETGTVSMPYRVSESALEDVMLLLSRTTIPSGGLAKFCVECSIPASSTAVVSEALLHHSTSINSLHLRWGEKGALYGVLHAISHLSRLTYLSLTIPAIGPNADPTVIATINRLASTISNLPSIADANFEVFSRSPESRTPPCKRPKVASAGRTPPATSLDPVIQALSEAPSLTSLTLAFSFGTCNMAVSPCSGIRGLFLSLQQLRIRMLGSDLPACQIFPPLSPLPAMKHLFFEYQRVHVDSGHVQGILQQPALQSLELGFHVLDRAAAQLLQERLHNISRLSHLAIDSRALEDLARCPDRVHSMAKGIAALPSLSSLDLNVPDIAVPNDAGWSPGDVHEKLLQPLSQCSMLKRLRCRFNARASVNELSGSVSESLVSHVLPAATQLTRLELAASKWGDDEANVADELLQGLPALPELRHLQIDALFFGSDEQAKHWFESLQVKHMTHLELRFGPVNEMTVKSLVRVLRGALEIQRVQVTALRIQHGSQMSWPRGLLGLPRRGSYEFWCTSSGEIAGISSKLKEEGFVVANPMWGILRCRYPVGVLPARAGAMSELSNEPCQT